MLRVTFECWSSYVTEQCNRSAIYLVRQIVENAIVRQRYKFVTYFLRYTIRASHTLVMLVGRRTQDSERQKSNGNQPVFHVSPS
jgi:hypothetical protein